MNQWIRLETIRMTKSWHTVWPLLISPSRGQPCLKGKKCWNVSKINCLTVFHLHLLYSFMFEHRPQWLTHKFPLQKPCLMKDNRITCLSLYEHECVLGGGPLQQLLCQSTATGLQQPGDDVKNTHPHVKASRYITGDNSLCVIGRLTSWKRSAGWPRGWGAGWVR